MSIDVQPAREEDVAACTALLPDLAGGPAEWLVARRDGVFAGVAGVAWRCWSDPPGFPFALHVLAPHRRQGVGRALAEAVKALARGEAPGLWSLKHVADEEPAAAFLQACGFQVARRDHRFEAELAVLAGDVRPLYARLKARGRLPAQARVASLDEAPLDAAGWLVTAEFGGAPVRALQGLRNRAAQGAGREDRSLAALDGERLVGVMLWRLVQGCLEVDARVVAPDQRNGWANLALLDATLEQGMGESATRFRFNCDSSVKDTLSLARRSAAQELSRAALYYYATAAS